MEVLIAEDDLIARTLLHQMIEAIGHRAVATENGEQAWRCIQARPIRMVITDWMMPEMDGLTLCRHIRDASLGRYVYIIMLTARDDRKDLVEVFRSGADDYIPKPFDPEELKARLLTGWRVIDLEYKYRTMEATLLRTAEENAAKTDKLEKALKRLEATRSQMVQSEKMASIGQLAAGVAHEINNPTGFVSSKLKTMEEYLKAINGLIRKYQGLRDLVKAMPARQRTDDVQAALREIAAYETDMEIEYILDDSTDLISDCREGADRIKKIVAD